MTQALTQAAWPGNVRELENLIERLVVVAAHPTVGLRDLAACRPGTAKVSTGWTDAEPVRTLRELEDEYVAWVLERCDGNKTRAAELLGIDVSTLHRRLRRDA